MSKTQNDAARSVADVSEGLVLATVDIAAPIGRVFRALTSPDELPKWWGSADMYQTTKCEADFREGGAWRSEGRGMEGGTFQVGGVYTRIEPPHRLDMTWKPDWETFESQVSYSLQAVDGGTRVTVRHSGFGDHAQACANHAFGWERVLGWLGAYVAPPAAERQAFVARLIPPRPTFAQDMTREEMHMMQAHSQYWRGKLSDGTAVAFGPVNDPSGSYGLAIIRAAGEDALKALLAADPAVAPGTGLYYETAPMFSLVTP